MAMHHTSSFAVCPLREFAALRPTLQSCTRPCHDKHSTAEQSQWLQVVLHGSWRTPALTQLVLYLSRLLLAIKAQRPRVWRHVPEMFVECAACVFHSLQRTLPATPLPATHAVAALLSELLAADAALASPYMRDVALQSVTNLLDNPHCLAVVERDCALMDSLVPRLMALYKQEHWGSLTGIFVMLLYHDGGLPYGSGTGARPFAQAMQARLVARDEATASFIPQLFAALDYAAAEVHSQTRELAAREAVGPRRRIAMFFSLAVGAAMMLAFVFAECPPVFYTGSGAHMARLSETLAFLIVHAPVDPQALLYQVLVDSESQLRGIVSAAHPLALAKPLVAILSAAWQIERGGAGGAYAAQVADIRAMLQQHGAAPSAVDAVTGAVEHSLVALLADMREALPTPALEALAGAPWHERYPRGADASPAAQLLHRNVATVKELAAEVRGSRAKMRDTTESLQCPSEFLDPITMAPMNEPVRLPDSGVVLDRQTLERHMASSNTDPYSRAELKLEDVRDEAELRARIEAWRSGASFEQRVSRTHSARAAGDNANGAGPSGAAGANGGELARGTKEIQSHAPTDWAMDSDTSSSLA